MARRWLSTPSLLIALALVWSLPIDGRTPPVVLELPRAATTLESEVAQRAWTVTVHAELLGAAAPLVVELPGREYEAALEPLLPSGLKPDELDDGALRSWQGSLRWAGAPSGRILLTRRGSQTAGWLQSELGTFHLLPGADGVHRLVEVDYGLLGTPFCSDVPLRRADPARSMDKSTLVGRSEVSPTVSVLVLYTVAAREQAGSKELIELRIENAVDFTDMALAESRVSARIELAHLEEIDYRPSTSDIREDVRFLATSPEVAELRERFGADEVGLVKARCEPTGCGFAAGMDRSTFGSAAAPIAYFVASAPALPENFAHELAHNFGCQHEPENAAPRDRAAFAFAYAHFEPGLFRTLVESFRGLCGECTTLPQFSNPEILYDGLPTGIAGERDNSRGIDLIAPTVARFGELAGKAVLMQGEVRILESAGPLTVEVQRLEGSIGAVSVVVRTRNGEARAGVDYRPLAERLSWRTGEAEVRALPQFDAARRRVRVEVLDDAVVEGDESFTLVLADPVGGLELGEPATMRVIVEDDDAGARFSEQEHEGVEGQTLALEVVRAGRTDETLEAEVRALGGSATRDRDYRFAPVSLRWPAGDLSPRTVTLPLLDDGDLEGNETLTLEIGIGSLVASTAEVTLLDDDGDRTPCSEEAPNLCLAGGRFRVEVDYAAAGEEQISRATPVRLTDSSGLFWFFDEGNVEMLLKVLDACALSEFRSYWVFYAATTDRYFRVRVTDTATGRIRDYTNQLGEPARPITDTRAFATCSASPSSRGAGERSASMPVVAASVCSDETAALCLDDGRFVVGVDYEDAAGELVSAHPIGLTDSSGLFWFFDEGNVEMLLKVLDACALPEFRSYWVFYAATTDRGFRVRVRDRAGGAVREYTNVSGIPALPVSDTAAFACTPP